MNPVDLRHGTDLLKRCFAKMQQGGVIMDVVTPEQAAGRGGRCCGGDGARARPQLTFEQGGVARGMSHLDTIQGIIETTSILVEAKARIDDDGEARVLESSMDTIDESEVLTPAHPFFHIPKSTYMTSRLSVVRPTSVRPFGASPRAPLRSVPKVRRGRATSSPLSPTHESSSRRSNRSSAWTTMTVMRQPMSSSIDIGPWQVPRFSRGLHLDPIRGHRDGPSPRGRFHPHRCRAGGSASRHHLLRRRYRNTADAALMMQHGMDGVFVGSGIFKSDDPPTMADAIVLATHHHDDPEKVAEACSMMKAEAMPGLELDSLDVRLEDRGW